MGNTPKLRFEGYSGDWDGHTLGDVFTQTSNYVNPKEDGIALWSLTVEDGLTPKTERYVREFLVKKDDKFKEVRPGDIVYNPMNMTLGAVGYNGMDHSVAVSGYYTTMVAREDYDAYFINTWLKSPQAILLYKAYATGTLLEKQRVQFPTLSIIPALFPLKDEQADVGTLFESIDELISLCQRKYEMLKRAKEFYLQNMFPLKGDTTPRMRFAGFTNAWGQHKLGELAIFNPKSDLPETFEYVDLESVVGTEMLSHRTETRETAPSRAQRLARAGDLFYQTVRPYQKNNYLFERQEKQYVFSTGYAQMRPVVDGRFLLSLVQNESFVKVVLDNCTGTSYPAINSNDLAQINVYAPRERLEQQQIGNFFKYIDDMITLHQHKASALQTTKKFLLQNMFV